MELEKINSDLGLYKSVLSRMNSAKELQAEVLERRLTGKAAEEWKRGGEGAQESGQEEGEGAAGG